MPCGGSKNYPRTLSIVQIIFSVRSKEVLLLSFAFIQAMPNMNFMLHDFITTRI